MTRKSRRLKSLKYLMSFPIDLGAELYIRNFTHGSDTSDCPHTYVRKSIIVKAKYCMMCRLIQPPVSGTPPSPMMEYYKTFLP